MYTCIHVHKCIVHVDERERGEEEVKEKFNFFSPQDSDVAEEKRKVNGMSSFSDSDAVVVRNLVKVQYAHASILLVILVCIKKMELAQKIHACRDGCVMRVHRFCWAPFPCPLSFSFPNRSIRISLLLCVQGVVKVVSLP